jgi:hypothetical protein
MLFWLVFTGVLLLLLGAGFWYDHKHGRGQLSDGEARDAVRAQRTRADNYGGSTQTPTGGL